MDGLPGVGSRGPPTRVLSLPLVCAPGCSTGPRVRVLDEQAPAFLYFGVPGLLLLKDPGASERVDPRSCLSRVLARALDAAPQGLRQSLCSAQGLPRPDTAPYSGPGAATLAPKTPVPNLKFLLPLPTTPAPPKPSRTNAQLPHGLGLCLCRQRQAPPPGPSAVGPVEAAGTWSPPWGALSSNHVWDAQGQQGARTS